MQDEVGATEVSAPVWKISRRNVLQLTRSWEEIVPGHLDEVQTVPFLLDVPYRVLAMASLRIETSGNPGRSPGSLPLYSSQRDHNLLLVPV